ncbi:MAG TPA: hypothetical protein ENN07_06240 [candidate division Zixibacteria bacterium]|nr:hypothetical protein [candidate division Zixibacteria bacterium]
MRKAVFLLLLCIVCIAGIPQTINYQGKLTNLSGVGENAELDMRFRIFGFEVGGDSLWTTTIDDVPIVHGLFDVNIGPIDLPFDEQYWLEIEVDGHILSPRMKLMSSPYAFRAAVADSFTGEGPIGLEGPQGEQGIQGVVDIRTVTSNTLLDDTYHTVLAEGTLTISLPPADESEGQIYVIKNIGTSSISIEPDGAELIESAASYKLGTQYYSIKIQSDGTQWWILSEKRTP